jgi:anti-sigma regulatory factor (Ser/Thr protein kinase)
MDLKIDGGADKFSAVLRDDGVPFDLGAEAAGAKDKPITGEGGERRLGLSLIARLVDSIHYSRDKGINQVVLEKAWQD